MKQLFKLLFALILCLGMVAPATVHAAPTWHDPEEPTDPADPGEDPGNEDPGEDPGEEPGGEEPAHTTHTWDNGTTTKAATCTEDGVMTYSCTGCDETKTETITKLGHDFSNNAEKCKNGCGTKNPDHTHTYENEWSYDASFHWYAPTCTDTSEMKDHAKHVSSGNATTEHDEHCTVCGYVITAKIDTRLKEINVSEGQLKPAFSVDVKDYTVELTSETKKISILASTFDDKAKVEGTGEKEIKVGDNIIQLEVTASDGKTKDTYTVKVIVTSVPTTFLNFEGQRYGIINEISSTIAVPKGFSESKMQIEGEECTAFVHSKKGITLLYVTDDSEVTAFYFYKDGEGLLGEFKQATIDGKTLYVLPVDSDLLRAIPEATFEELPIQSNVIEGWTFRDDDLKDTCLLYLMKDTGQMGYFIYDKEARTLAEYKVDGEHPLTLDAIKEFTNGHKKGLPLWAYGAIGGAALVLIGGGVAFAVISGKKKKAAKIVASEPEVNVEDTLEIKRNPTRVTDETFFSNIPENEEDDHVEDLIPNISRSEIPQNIEQLLMGMDSKSLDKTKVATTEELKRIVIDPETPAEEDDYSNLMKQMMGVEASDAEQEDDDWLDLSNIDKIFNNDDE